MNFMKDRLLGLESNKDLTSKQPPPKNPTKVSLAQVFYGSNRTNPPLKSMSSNPMMNVEENLPTYMPVSSFTITTQSKEYDNLALLLYRNLERDKNRRRIHDYADTFYGKTAVDWLVGNGVFSEPNDARNALRHLLERRLIVRADHTKPFFNDTYERIAPIKAKEREVRYRNQFASSNRGFHDQHLYRFPSESYCRTMVVVKVIGARNLIFRSRLHLGPFVLNSKFVNRTIDPYCLLTYHKQNGKTDTCENAANGVEWGNDFIFYNETSDETQETFRDLWVKVFDFHEVLGDLEIGYCLVMGADLASHCADGKEWKSWHVLRPSSGLSANDRAYGEIELSIKLVPFFAKFPGWTVFQSSRRIPPQVKGDAIFEFFEDQNETSGITFSNDVTKALMKGVDEVVNLGTKIVVNKTGEPSPNPGGDKNYYTLNVQKCYIHRVSDLRNDAEIWVEYSLHTKDATLRAKSERVVWPIKELGVHQLRGIKPEYLITPNGTPPLQLSIKLYQYRAGLTMKMGEGVVSLNKFMPDLDALVETNDNVDFSLFAKTEKVPVKRIAALRRNRKILVGDLTIKAVIQPSGEQDEDTAEDDGNANADESLMVVEDDLFNTVSCGIFSSQGPFTVPPPLPNIALDKKIVECSLEKLSWLILSRNSPVFPAFCQKMKFTKMEQGDWKWEVKRDRRLSEDDISAEPPPAEPAAVHISRHSTLDSVVATSAMDRRISNDSVLSSSPEKPSKEPSSPAKINEGSSPAKAINEGSVEAALSPTPPPPFIKQGSLSLLAQMPLLSMSTAEGLDNEDVVVEEEEGKKQLRPRGNTSSSHLDDWPSRSVTYVRPPETLVASLTVKETWRLKGYVPEQGFWVEIEGHTNEPTYGANMSALNYIVGVKETDNTCTLSVSSQVVWKSRPSLTGGLVERTANSGTNASYAAYLKVVQSACATKKKKGKTLESEEEMESETVSKSSRWKLFAWMLFSRLLAIVLALVFIYMFRYWDLIQAGYHARSLELLPSFFVFVSSLVSYHI